MDMEFDYEPLLTPAEVAWIFRVDPKTVQRWSNEGQINCLRTPGGHRRYRESEVQRLLQKTEAAKADAA